MSFFDEGEKKKMRRLLLLIFVLLLLIDLGDDGFPGKVKFVSPLPPSAGSSVSSPHCDVEQVNSRCELPVRDLSGTFNHYQYQRLTCNVWQKLEIISSCHTSSSGGMPLQFTFLCPSVLLPDFF
jgi:hypothetical protein